MASAPLLDKKKARKLLLQRLAHGAGHSKASIFYGADEYLAELQKKYERDHEIAALKLAQPDEGDPHAPSSMAKSKEKILSVEKNDQNRTQMAE
ncbi:Uncharacterized protein SCF082_LOCUS25916 [Durusdinium trenchii]|uniref:Uncharacterized protein n=1 Tax=Durusdinium trenchii TaxID=1381693 RepID=A0ABP0M415_9DINO